MLWSLAYAQAGGAPRPGLLEQMAPFIVILVIFYFLIIRPQSKRQKTHQDFLQKMKRGDSVLTTGGILGTVEGITDKFVTLEVDEGVRIKMLKSQIAGPSEQGKT